MVTPKRKKHHSSKQEMLSVLRDSPSTQSASPVQPKEIVLVREPWVCVGWGGHIGELAEVDETVMGEEGSRSNSSSVEGGCCCSLSSPSLGSALEKASSSSASPFQCRIKACQSWEELSPTGRDTCFGLPFPADALNKGCVPHALAKAVRACLNRRHCTNFADEATGMETL